MVVLMSPDCESLQRKQAVKEFSDSVKPCDGSIHKFSCNNGCRKYTCILNIVKSQTEHYCFGRRIAGKAVDWLKVVGCASFRDDVSGHNAK